MNESLKTVDTAYDMKAVIILTCCDLIQALLELGDEQGARALSILIETIEQIPTK